MAAAKRKKWLPQQFELAVKQPRVRMMLQYNVIAPAPSVSTFTTGLLNASGPLLPDYGRLEAWSRNALKTGKVKRSTGAISLPDRPGGIPTEPPTTTPPPTGTGGGGGGSGSGGGTTVPPPPPPSSGGGSSSPPPSWWWRQHAAPVRRWWRQHPPTLGGGGGGGGGSPPPPCILPPPHICP